MLQKIAFFLISKNQPNKSRSRYSGERERERVYYQILNVCLLHQIYIKKNPFYCQIILGTSSLIKRSVGSNTPIEETKMMQTCTAKKKKKGINSLILKGVRTYVMYIG